MKLVLNCKADKEGGEIKQLLCQARGLQQCLFLVPWHFNKIFYFYIICNGFAMGERGA